MTTRLLEGDALVMLAELEAGSIDACVTDPPYGLGFMGVGWDTFKHERRLTRRQTTSEAFDNIGGNHNPSNSRDQARTRAIEGRRFQEWAGTWLPEVYRILKPGSHLVAFGGTRTYHRLTCAIEDAGFEIRDCLMWLYGSGFPKGKGCLKPGWEPIVLARKPAPAPWLNIDGCRIDSAVGATAVRGTHGSGLGKSRMYGDWLGKYDGPSTAHRESARHHAAGRWPANVVLSHEDGCREDGQRTIRTANGSPGVSRAFDSGYQGNWPERPVVPYGNGDGSETVAAWECVLECAVRLLDEQSGHLHGSGNKADVGVGADRDYGASSYHVSYAGRANRDYGAQGGGASRFFYCPKASTAERGAGNDHPTVKPLALMRWLVRLVTPPGGVILDPFCGSGSTLLAADVEGFESVGIDSDPHAIEITRRRLADAVGPLFAAHEVSA